MGRRTVTQRRVTLLTKPGCHLCDDVRPVLERVTRELGISLEEVDITSDPELFRRWRDLIPVTLVDGREHARWRISEQRLRRVLGR